MAAHRPLAEKEAERPEYNTSPYVVERAAQPKWKAGQGLNDCTDIPGHAEFAAKNALAPNKFTHFDPKQIIADGKGIDLYKLLINGAVPRPIAFVSSLSADGRANLSPFSYFQILSHNPPIVMVSVNTKKPMDEGDTSNSMHKDTGANIKATKEFTVNIVSEPFAEAMNYTSIDSPPEVSEWALCGLTQVASTTIRPPRVGESAYSMECTLDHSYDMTNADGKITASALFGRITAIHVRKDIFIEGQGNAIDPGKLLPVSRMGGITYGRVSRGFELERPVWAKHKDTPEVQAALERGDRKLP